MNQAIAIEQRPVYDPAIMAPKKRTPTSAAPTPPPPPPAQGCPEGLPNNLDLSALATHILKNPEVRRDASKHRLNKMLRAGGKESSAPVLKFFPCNTRQLKRLSTKQLGAVIVAAEVARRHYLAVDGFSRGQGGSTIEAWLINNWLKERVDRSATIIDEAIKEDGTRGAGLIASTDVEYLTGENAIIGGLASRCEGPGLDSLIRGMIHRGWVTTMYQDIYDNGPHAERAALAVFALASWTNSRWPLDLVYQRCEELHAAHYSCLVYCSLPEHVNAHVNDLLDVPGKYEPLTEDLLTPDFVATMNFFSLRSLLAHAGSEMLKLSNEFNLDGKAAWKLSDDHGLLLDSTKMFQHAIDTLKSRVETMASEYAQGTARALTLSIISMHDDFSTMYPEYANTDRPTMKAFLVLAKRFDEFTRDLDGRPLESRQSLFMAAVSAENRLVSVRRAQVDYLLDAGEQVRAKVTELVKEDPLGNQGQIAESYKELESLRGRRDDADDMLGEWAQRTAEIFEREISAKAESRLDEDERNEELEPGHDYAALLEVATEDGKAFQSENMELKSRVESLEAGLAGQRCSRAEDGMSQEVREAMQAAMSGGNALTPIQCLLLVKSIFPSTEILPNAWSSAQDAEKFGQTDKLWEALSTLAGKYTEAIVGGTPDSEARKMFTAFQYAANESETTSNSHLRKHREFQYQGESMYFDQHLRFGVAKDVRKTIRVHFKIIDSVLVIAYCGAHRKL